MLVYVYIYQVLSEKFEFGNLRGGGVRPGCGNPARLPGVV